MLKRDMTRGSQLKYGTGECVHVRERGRVGRSMYYGRVCQYLGCGS